MVYLIFPSIDGRLKVKSQTFTLVQAEPAYLNVSMPHCLFLLLFTAGNLMLSSVVLLGNILTCFTVGALL